MKKSRLWYTNIAVIVLLSGLYILFTEPFRTGEEAFLLGQQHFARATSTEQYDLALAKEYYKQAVAKGYDDPELWYQLSRIYFLEGEFSQAETSLKKQEKIYGDRIPALHYTFGLVYGYRARETGDIADWEQAAQHFRTYRNYAPHAAWPVVDLGWVYFSLGDYKKLGNLLLVAESQHTNNPWVNNLRGLYWHNQSDSKRARVAFMQSLRQTQYLTAEDWGTIYPGNDPRWWKNGLQEFRSTVFANLLLTYTQSQPFYFYNSMQL